MNYLYIPYTNVFSSSPLSIKVLVFNLVILGKRQLLHVLLGLITYQFLLVFNFLCSFFSLDVALADNHKFCNKYIIVSVEFSYKFHEFPSGYVVSYQHLLKLWMTLTDGIGSPLSFT